MRFRRYAVTVMDNWTPMREFFTFAAAYRFRKLHAGYAFLYWWRGDQWVELIVPKRLPNASASQDEGR